MRLSPRQRRLDLIDGTLRAEAPGLAAKFDLFTRLARGEGDPPSEERFRAAGGWRRRVSAWWHRRIRMLAPVRLRRSLYAGIPR